MTDGPPAEEQMGEVVDMTADLYDQTREDADRSGSVARHPSSQDRALLAHYYCSPCIHGAHRLCKLRCEFCGTACRCRCYVPPQAQERRDAFERRERAATRMDRVRRGGAS